MAPNGRTYLPEADDVTFTQLSDAYYAKDRYLTIYQGLVISNADPDTFKFIDGYWRDKNRVYYPVNYTIPIAGADPRSFRRIRYDWARDDRNVYAGFTPVDPKDIATFQVLNEYWAKDSRYYCAAELGDYKPL